jgi:formylglycine-generating enzyme required for sulfatase activity
VYVPAFAIERHEVSNGQYRLCVEADVCGEPNEPYDDAAYRSRQDDLPVAYVTAYQAAQFCAWTGRRLPTVDQWERAAAGLDGRRYPWGEEPPTPARVNAIVRPSIPQARVPVTDRRYAAGRTPEGVEHLLGNVAEWTSSPVRYVKADPGGPGAQQEPYMRWDPRWDGVGLVRLLVLEGPGYAADAAPVGVHIIAEPTASNLDFGFRCIDDT